MSNLGGTKIREIDDRSARSDLASLVLVALVAIIGTFLLGNVLLGDPNEAVVEFTALSEPISSELMQPESEVFNSHAINPTIEVYVGSCEDIDQNGILDAAELTACGQSAPEEVEADSQPALEETEAGGQPASGEVEADGATN